MTDCTPSDGTFSSKCFIHLLSLAYSYACMSLVMDFVVHAQVTPAPARSSHPSISLERLLVEPRPEDGQRRRVLRLRLVPPQRPVLVSQRVRRQHDGQLQFDGFLQVARRHDELQREGRKKWRVILQYCLAIPAFTRHIDRQTESHRRIMSA